MCVFVSLDFRFKSKAVFLTYPRCDGHTKEEVIEALRTKLGGQHRWKSMVCGKEQHVDGSEHYHILLIFVKAPDFRSPRCFDLLLNGVNFHPNIKKVGCGKNDIQYAAEYCEKEGDFVSEHLDLFRNSNNFVKKMADRNAFLRWCGDKALREPLWPIAFPGHLGWPPMSNSPSIKRRHIWITGRPDIGKTSFIQDTFAGYKIYIVPPKSKYPFDNYNNEQVIVYDDHWPDFDTASNITQVWRVSAPIPGDQRYHAKQWKVNQARLVFVLANKSLEEVYSSSELPGMRARFIEYVVPDGTLLYAEEQSEGEN